VQTDGCLGDCTLAACGDTIVQADVEECDDGNMVQTDACLNTCEAAKCGDSIVQAGVEACDDGNMVDNDMCSNTCQIPLNLRTNVLLCGTSGYDIRKFAPAARPSSQAITLAEAGCCFTVNAFPGITPIAGWDAHSASIGYRDLSLGRLWVTDFDRQDSMPNVNMTYTNTLMGYMLTHRK
jgi:cysteine-rich repeat protein